MKSILMIIVFYFDIIMLVMKRLFKIFISSFYAGILISISGIGYLSLKSYNVFAGAFLFSLGLLMIISFKLYLFTGKIGYLFDNNKNYLCDLGICWIGNCLGALFIGYLLRLTRLDLINICEEISLVKLSDNYLSVFILSLLCGMMIYLAVEIQKRDVSNVVKLLGIILPVMVFIVSGFEHCVANMFYFSYSNVWSFKALLYILIMTLGNSLGSILLWGLNKIMGDLK